MKHEDHTYRDAAISFMSLVGAGKVREAYERHVGANFRHHNAFFPGDRESLMRAMEENAARNPAKVLDVKHALEDGNYVAVHSHIRPNAQDRGGAAVHKLWDVGQAIPQDSPNEFGMFWVRERSGKPTCVCRRTRR